MEKSKIALQTLRAIRAQVRRDLTKIEVESYLPASIKDAVEPRMEALLEELEEQISKFQDIIQSMEINQGLGL
tara:strand:+ start:135 stop:353 length:219 start_codon:yes stop_codon:yes gene_type:complete